MQEFTNHSPSPALQSSLQRPEQTRVLGTERRVWPAISAFVSYRLFVAHRQMQILSSSFRSFLGHMRIQSPKEGYLFSCGPALVRDQTGHYQPNARTHARGEGIRALLAKHPWADRPDFQIFLEGFDAGEQFARSANDRQ
jgi:hypothetical protein